MTSIQRREFLGLFAAAGLSRAFVQPFTAAPALRIRLASDDQDVVRGATMAVEEAQRAAELFGGTVSLGDGSGLRVVIGGVPRGAVDAVHMNVTDLSPEDRGCRREVFHVASGSWGVTWLPTLNRFGADSLNRRYRERYAAGMSAAAWCAWFAVKCSWEAALKSKATDTAGLIAYLESPGARFDGHKGVALFFAGDHQLRQPMYDDKGAETLQNHPDGICVWK